MISANEIECTKAKESTISDGLGGVQVLGACCSAQKAHTPVLTSSEKHTTGAKSLLPVIYTVDACDHGCLCSAKNTSKSISSIMSMSKLMHTHDRLRVIV